MKHPLAAALIAVSTMVVSDPIAPTAMAHEVYNQGDVVHIDRQCDRYGYFCGSHVQVTKKHKHATKVRARTESNRTSVAKSPFIERQCIRYDNFC